MAAALVDAFEADRNVEMHLFGFTPLSYHRRDRVGELSHTSCASVLLLDEVR